MAVAKRIRTAWKEIRETALKGDALSLLLLSGPACGTGLSIIFTPGDSKAIEVLCETCNAASHIDGEFATSPWVAILGPKTITNAAEY